MVVNIQEITDQDQGHHVLQEKKWVDLAAVVLEDWTAVPWEGDELVKCPLHSSNNCEGGKQCHVTHIAHIEITQVW